MNPYYGYGLGWLVLFIMLFIVLLYVSGHLH